jgi:hypothetical protein
MKTMTQEAPWPEPLQEAVARIKLMPGYVASLLVDYDRGQGSRGLTLCIMVTCKDSYHPDEDRTVAHLFIVPAAGYDYRAWRRWLLDRYLDVLTHEACEWFIDGDERPYAPNHGPGRDPYVIHEIGTDLDRRTSFRGEVKDADL